MFLGLTAQVSPLPNAPYFYEYGGFNEQGEEQTYFFLTKSGYENLIIPEGDEVLVNTLLQIKENQKALNNIIEAQKISIAHLQQENSAILKTLKHLDIEILRTMEEEVDYLRQAQPAFTTLYNRYYKTRNTKNGFSMQEIDIQFGGDGKGTKKKMALRILEKIK